MQIVNTLETLDDTRLFERIANERDKKALAELYDRYRHSLGGFIRRKVYQDKLVDEIYNDVMLTVWQKAGDFRGESKASTWIFGIAYRISMTHVRKEMKHTQNMVNVEFDEMKAKPDPSSSENDLVDQLRIATANLKENHREVIELSYFHGHSLREISEIVGCPENTVKTRLFHARQNLKIVLDRAS